MIREERRSWVTVGRVKEKFGLTRIKGLSDDFTRVEKGIRETRKTMEAR